ncbi:hypothetical protein [Vibrio neptunius]|uniref:Uncharacterized protein n=1 Tax=Vibrio neptunius TaxID=170651 RepID=A0ABS3A8G4_9VIBR|nr:hypothetical protein [Vibrio neptunius]MBN3494747.1 hypothetical protein [Vibrio neptunius]MBN3517107.1 hypothetical protein [Vibrio neptunius]MBN3551211.1 hypothetical protein [Vibrio neptunius]MBN3579503.1 hypothetical protein [Vibrio neptunius]MCH9873168.1 hypothetical protein [Vibrio neptunius]
MGLHVHSLENIPKTNNRDFLVYLLDYGWHESLSEALRTNYEKMAGIAAKNRAVVIKGTEGIHFQNEVFSWHQINDERGDDILPAILVTNAHPEYFRENNTGYSTAKGHYRESTNENLKLVLIPLKKFCNSTTEVVSLIEKLFSDIESGKDLSDFKIAKEAKKGIGHALVDSVVLEPNIAGVGFSFNRLIDFIKSK